MSGTIIIGASHAGLSCAEKLRQLGYEAEITVIERDKGMPIQRPPLSKAYLAAEDADEDSFALRRPAFFEQMDVAFKDGLSVSAIHADDNTVILSDDSRLTYSNLVLATGAVPRRLPTLADGIRGVHVLRTAADARGLRADLQKTKTAIVIGGGYIGLEAAASLRKHGIDVHVVELAARLLARVASSPISAFYQNLHEGNGVHVHLQTAIDRFLIENDHIAGVELQNGNNIACDMLLVGIGVIPDMNLAERSGIRTGNGILVDSDYRTNIDNIFAIGDVAHCAERWGMRLESIHHAQFSGALVASSITGGKPPVNEAPWFWSDQYDVKLQIAGLVPASGTEGLTHQMRPGRKEGSLSIWSWQGNVLKAVESANDPKAYMVGKACLEKGVSPSPEQIADIDTDLKLLLKA